MKCPCCGSEVPYIDVMFLMDIELGRVREQVLKALIDAYPRGLKVEQLIQQVYPLTEPEGSENCIRVHINQLRKKLQTYNWTIFSERESWGPKYRLRRLA